MAKSRQAKAEESKRLADGFKKAKGVVFVDYKGLTVKADTQLRRTARASGVDYVVAKKTLIDVAARDAGFEINARKLVGNIAVAFGLTDEVGAAQVIANLSKENEAMKIVGGMLEGKLIDAAQVKALAALPSKHQLLGQLAGVLNAPLTGLASALAGIPRGFVTALHGVQEKKSAA